MNHLERHLKVTDEQAPALRVAFASSDMKTVDQHFGSCERLLIYGVEPDRAELLQVAGFQVAQGHDPAKLQSRIEVIDGCFTLFCVAVGESVFRQLLAAGIRAVRVESGTPINQLIRQLQSQWPAAAAQRREKKRSQDRFAELENDSWDAE